MGEQLQLDVLGQYWRSALDPSATQFSWDLQNTLLSGLRLNVLEVSRYVHSEKPTLEEFEAWVVERHGGSIDKVALDRLRRAMAGDVVEPHTSLDGVEGLSEADLAHWDEHGYVVVKNAVSAEAAEAAELAIYEFLGMGRDDAESWYAGALGHSIWVPLLRHPALETNRHSPRIAKVFSQLWGREDLWVNVDQGGVNPPERPGWMFPGPHLHWDTTLAEPHCFDVLGILYLVDVAENQGAFSCVPGFHRRLTAWLKEVPAGVEPRDYARRTLTLQPIAAQRGDLIIWHQSLPHGSSPNRAAHPRVVQYMTMRPTRFEYNENWV